MPPRLTREYIGNHMEDVELIEREDAGGRQMLFEDDAADSFASALVDRILVMAQQETGSEEPDEIDFSVPVTVKAVDPAPQGGCIGIQIGPITYHRNFKGKWPGKG